MLDKPTANRLLKNDTVSASSCFCKLPKEQLVMTSNRLKLIGFSQQSLPCHKQVVLSWTAVPYSIRSTLFKKNAKYSKQAQDKMLQEIYFVAIIRSTHMTILLPHITKTEKLS